jgi:aryl sulfotransferase
VWNARAAWWQTACAAPVEDVMASSETIDWPVKSREVVQFLLDSRPWNDFPFRADDIVIGTWSKAGTTLVQQIVGQLVFDGAADLFAMAHSPWVDSRIVPGGRERAEQQAHRRFLKTHLPIDALVFSPNAKYIYVGRDGRDVCWSWYNHHASFTQSALDTINSLPGMTGQPFGPPDPDIKRYYHTWLDNDAHPNVSFWSHVQGWWDIRNLPNVLLLHFNDLTADLPGQIRKIADFLDIVVDEQAITGMVEHCSLDHMKRLAAAQEGLNSRIKAGRFIHMGTNGRWRDVLSADDIAKCDAIAAAQLAPDCARWLATGALPD